MSTPGYRLSDRTGISDLLISATSERRQPTPIIQICARLGLSRHAALGVQNGGSGAFSPAFSIIQRDVVPSAEPDADPRTLCGVAGLKAAAGREARRCCEQTARLPLA
jgi:hypothetical protein